MKTQTSLKSGLMPLTGCKSVKVSGHNRGSTAGNKVFATCPFHGFWVPAQGWFPANKTVYWDDNAARLTGR